MRQVRGTFLWRFLSKNQVVFPSKKILGPPETWAKKWVLNRWERYSRSKKFLAIKTGAFGGEKENRFVLKTLDNTEWERITILRGKSTAKVDYRGGGAKY